MHITDMYEAYGTYVDDKYFDNHDYDDDTDADTYFGATKVSSWFASAEIQASVGGVGGVGLGVGGVTKFILV